MSHIGLSIAYRRRLIDPYLDEVLTQLPGVLVVGPRAAGKTTTFGLRSQTIVRLANEAEAAAFRADADAALRGLPEPVLLDEWQEVPTVFGAAARAINESPTPARFFLTGSVDAHLQNKVYAGSGRIVRMAMYPMTVREKLGKVDGETFFDKVAEGKALTVPSNTPDIRGYVDLALESGFPVQSLILSGAARTDSLEAYVSDLLTHDIPQFEELQGADRQRQRRRDPERLRRFFEAYALNSAGIPSERTLLDAAQINAKTAKAYESLLTGLFIAEAVPAWTSNRLKRLALRPKRYLIDAALIAAALRIDANGVMRDGDLLGRVLDTFVAAQLRPELAVSKSRPRLHHLRTQNGREEVDILAELGGERVIGIEIKANAAPRANEDDKHLVWLRDQLGDRFVAGIVFHTGPRLYPLNDRIVAAPISALWG